VDILLGTPLRLARLVRRKRVDLGAVRDLVCDEADQLLGAGLLAQLDRVLAACTRADKARRGSSARVIQGGYCACVFASKQSPAETGAATAHVPDKELRGTHWWGRSALALSCALLAQTSPAYLLSPLGTQALPQACTPERPCLPDAGRRGQLRAGRRRRRRAARCERAACALSRSWHRAAAPDPSPPRGQVAAFFSATRGLGLEIGLEGARTRAPHAQVVTFFSATG